MEKDIIAIFAVSCFVIIAFISLRLLELHAKKTKKQKNKEKPEPKITKFNFYVFDNLVEVNVINLDKVSQEVFEYIAKYTWNTWRNYPATAISVLIKYEINGREWSAGLTYYWQNHKIGHPICHIFRSDECFSGLKIKFGRRFEDILNDFRNGTINKDRFYSWNSVGIPLSISGTCRYI